MRQKRRLRENIKNWFIKLNQTFKTEKSDSLGIPKSRTTKNVDSVELLIARLSIISHLMGVCIFLEIL